MKLDLERLPKQGWVYAGLAVGYILLVAGFMTTIVVHIPDDTPLLPITLVLSLFVFSAAVMGLLFLGRPTLLYLDGQKEQAVRLLLATVGYFFVIAVIATSLALLLAHI